MNFRKYVNKEFSKNTLKELEVLLAHHIEDAEKYKNSDETAYNSSLKDIKLIKAAIAKLKQNEKNKPVKTAGNQNLSSSDSISVGGEGGTTPASSSTSTDGGGAAIVGGPVV